MDVRAEGVESDPSEQPEYEKNYKKCPKHGVSPGGAKARHSRAEMFRELHRLHSGNRRDFKCNLVFAAVHQHDTIKVAKPPLEVCCEENYLFVRRGVRTFWSSVVVLPPDEGTGHDKSQHPG